MKFEIGKTYWTRSICDHNCIFRITVLKRTAKTIVVKVHNFHDEKRLKLKDWDGVEYVEPLGSYSMSPMIKADKVAA